MASNKAQQLDEADIEGLGVVKAGQKVLHPKFGKGVIQYFIRYHEGTTGIWVLFQEGPKLLHPKYAALKLAE